MPGVLTSKQKKLLILGSDFVTAQVVNEAHKYGLYVIASDLMEQTPTKMLADEAWLISTTDTDALIRKCKEEGVTALMFGARDFNVWNARKVCKQLNLPIYCESDYACRVARDKGEFKRICKAVGAPVATDYFLTDALSEEELNGVVFPVVVKPVDKSGNRGMSYCSNRDELIAGYKSAREISDKEIIVERRLHGKEYNVHYVLAEGHARLLYFSSTHHEPGEAENLYSFKCTTSLHLKQFIDEVDERAKAVIQRAECKEGIVWFDCIRDDDGHFYLLEMGYRFGGVMTYAPYEQVTGFNTVRWMLECALGVKHTVEDMPPALDSVLTGCAASYNLFSRRDGQIKEYIKNPKLKIRESFSIKSEEYDFYDRHSHWTVWGVLYKKRLLAGLKFKNGLYVGEDTYFLSEVIKKADRIAFIDEYLIYYIISLDSASHGNFTEKKYTELESWRAIAKLYSNRPEQERNIRATYAKRCIKMIKTYYPTSEEFRKKYYKATIKEYRKNAKFSLKEDISRREWGYFFKHIIAFLIPRLAFSFKHNM